MWGGVRQKGKGVEGKPIIIREKKRGGRKREISLGVVFHHSPRGTERGSKKNRSKSKKG